MSSNTADDATSIAIIGVGQVGSATAYALVTASIVSDLLLVDIDPDLLDGQVRDLSDVAFVSNSRTHVRAATYHEASKCDIVVITVGFQYHLGQTTTEYTYRKVSLVRNIIHAMSPFCPNTILIVVANPVDLLTSLAKEISGLRPCQVLGPGTFLDSVRLRWLLADQIGVAASSIDVYILGVQGDNQVIAWSTATIAGVPLDDVHLKEHQVDRAELEAKCKSCFQGIVKAKGTTPLGISCIVASICTSILMDKCNIRPVSHFQPDTGCCYGMPAVIGRRGIVNTVHMPLDQQESNKIAETVEDLQSSLSRIRLDE